MAGAAYGADGVARAGMGVTAGDFDNDGAEDILVTNPTREGSTLYHNNGRENSTTPHRSLILPGLASFQPASASGGLIMITTAGWTSSPQTDR